MGRQKFSFLFFFCEYVLLLLAPLSGHECIHRRRHRCQDSRFYVILLQVFLTSSLALRFFAARVLVLLGTPSIAVLRVRPFVLARASMSAVVRVIPRFCLWKWGSACSVEPCVFDERQMILVFIWDYNRWRNKRKWFLMIFSERGWSGGRPWALPVGWRRGGRGQLFKRAA